MYIGSKYWLSVSLIAHNQYLPWRKKLSFRIPMIFLFHSRFLSCFYVCLSALQKQHWFLSQAPDITQQFNSKATCLLVFPLWFPLALIFTCACLLTNIYFVRCSAVVHGQGKGWGAVAQQTDLTEAGETHGKSCDLKDTTNAEDSFCSQKVLFCLLYVNPCHIVSVLF